MDDISLLNQKYRTVESILTSSGKLCTSIVRRDYFKKLDIYKKIMDDTKELDVFDNMSFKDRVSYIVNKVPLEKCPICGKPHIRFENSQTTYRLCRHHFNVDHEKLSSALKNAKGKSSEELICSISDKTMMMDERAFRNSMDMTFYREDNYNFAITGETFPFLHDLLVKTEHIIPVDRNDMRFSERLYLAVNGIDSIPKCMFCGKEVRFRNRKTGYSRVCPEHIKLLSGRNRALGNIERLKESIDAEKYEITSLPERMTVDPLRIRCRKCGKESEWYVKNGMLGTIAKKHLCRHCEMNHSMGEDELFGFLRRNYRGKIVHGPGGRSTIYPKELDFYLPEIKLAIEYDGIYWHSENGGGKGRSYHLDKTLECERRGIRLIHVFENEWLLKREIAESRILNLLGIYERTVYARKCLVREIGRDEAKAFLDQNHIQGSCEARVSLGLMESGNLIALMTFSKPRFRKDSTGWELVRFCTKLGYHIPGGASKLLRHFEREYRPESILSYADRRWSNGGLYRKLGFELKNASKPNYWYFKDRSVEIFNRVMFQKHRLEKILELYDPEKSESENMFDNGYDRIFDCGNLVFEKTFV